MLWKRLLELDSSLSNRLRLRSENKLGWYIAAFFAHSGDPWYWYIGFGLIWFLAEPGWHYRAAVLIIAMTLEGALNYVIKFLFRRNRPKGEWGILYRLTDPHSFPSGHAARAALLAVMGVGLGPQWFAGLLLLNLPLVSLARVIMGVHYLSDILVGILVGLIIGLGLINIQYLMPVWLPFLF